MNGPRRMDARRNREAIVRAADDAFAENAQGVSVEEVAQRAGVGRATAYRHFPDRFALANAVADHNFGILGDALAGKRFEFRDIFHAVLTVQVSMRSLAAVAEDLPDGEKQKLADRMLAMLTPPFREAQEQGLIRAGIEPFDLLLLMRMLGAGLEALPEDADPDQVGQRLIGVLLHGIFRQPGAPQADVPQAGSTK